MLHCIEKSTKIKRNYVKKGKKHLSFRLRHAMLKNGKLKEAFYPAKSKRLF